MATLFSYLIDESIEQQIGDTLAEFSGKLKELVNFGINILEHDFNNGTIGDGDLPAALFLRNLLEEIDAIGILIRFSSIDPCKTLLRTALENFFSLEYLFEKETEKRSLCFIVWNAIENQKWIHKADIASNEYKIILAKYSKDNMLRGTLPLGLTNANKLIGDIKKLLSLPKYAAIKSEYDRTALKNKRPAWYSLFNGPKTMEELANLIGFPALYEVLYRGWSSSAHGNDIIQGKLSVSINGTVDVFQIRNPKDAQSITQHCFNIGILACRTYIEKRKPISLKELNQWYGSVRDFVLKLGRGDIITVQ